ncbi:hypothetical protein MHU86_16029 [Fragilaria crotonensis]|nr:hypothetical protein MHU86_16029 [Fragilaria crotonensis]
MFLLVVGSNIWTTKLLTFVRQSSDAVLSPFPPRPCHPLVRSSNVLILRMAAVNSVAKDAVFVDAVSDLVPAALASVEAFVANSFTVFIDSASCSTFSDPEFVAKKRMNSVDTDGWFSNWCSTYPAIIS